MPKPSDDGFLLSRLRLQLSGAEDLTAQLSAVAFTPEGHLWVGSDELRSVERLSIVAPYSYGERKSFPLDDLLGLSGRDEIDIEGMDYAGGYLYLTGSHSLKRKQAKGKKKDGARLETVVREPNRYLVARVPVVNGELLKSYAPAENADAPLRAGALPLTDSGNTLHAAQQRTRREAAQATRQPLYGTTAASANAVCSAAVAGAAGTHLSGAASPAIHSCSRHCVAVRRLSGSFRSSESMRSFTAELSGMLRGYAYTPSRMA